MEKVGSRALIVEGGAMRGVFSCGILDHFLASEFSPFDSFWGVSAGASNLAAYLAKMPGRNLKIYLDYSLRKEFISPSQLLRGGDMMNLDWMWNVTLEELGIDKSVLKADSRPFFLGVTRQDNGQAEYHLPDVDDLAETMKASSALPVLYRNGVSLNGIQYVDGGVSDALPVAEAIKRGAKKIMVLRSQPASYQKPRGRFSALTRKMLKETPGLIEPMLTREVRYNQTLALINNPPPGIEIIQVCPPETFKLKRLSRSPAPLRHAYELGIEAGKEAIIRWSQK
ncbi:patatin family protein [Vibrio sp. Vb2880]|jgi:predicted patatin/cPLA2 family phospholipase|uniref:patatin-like phospholipase family protein n=1 Tax=Vibrio TaxID=662 RepID=UPI001BD4EB05|nr:MULTISPECIES: patatin family protein [Vibrio]EGQ9097216.1 patatin family protein [Vibrio alginolyticus]MBS9937202.1 patatin family protein [Vibrio alginolyticus]MBT0052153.1 patatin family protein [Vibrio alginolyticus]MCR9528051.1 patatin family protein [Vibrio alginolyticus]MDW1574654.1 patatin family protein [Vibrio sp. Vb2880]